MNVVRERNRRWTMVCMAIALVALVSATGHAQATKRPTRRTVPMLLDQVRAKDPSATLTAAELGAAAGPGLLPLSRDGDADVREIAILCLAESGGPEAMQAFLERVADPEPTVRAAALRGMSRRATPAAVPQLLAALGRASDPATRAALLVLAGRLGTAGDLPAVRHACEAYPDAESQIGCVTARAWLGEAQAQDEFGRRLLASGDRLRVRYLEYAEQIKARWLLPVLAKLLDDTAPARWVGVDGGPPPETLRVCDVAINLVAAITSHPWSFAINPRRNYSSREVEDVRTFLTRRP